MDTSQFMDKQIMEFSGTQKQPDPAGYEVDHGNENRPPPPPAYTAATEGIGAEEGEGRDGVGPEEEIVPSYDFHQIRAPAVDPTPPPPPIPMATDSLSSNDEVLVSHESSEFTRENEKKACDATMLVEFDRVVKKHADNLLYSLEGISSRLSQLETRSRQLENSVEELKLKFGDNVGSADGKLRQLENILREVQAGMLILHNNTVSLDAQKQKMAQSSMSDNQYVNVPPPHTMQQLSEAQQQHHNLKTGMQISCDNRESSQPQQPPEAQSTVLNHQYASPLHTMQQLPETLQQQQQPSALQELSVLPHQHPTLAGSQNSLTDSAPSLLQQTSVQVPPVPPLAQTSSVAYLPRQFFPPQGQPSIPLPNQPQEPRNQQHQAAVQPPPLVAPPLHCQQPSLQLYQASSFSQTPPAQAQIPPTQNPEGKPLYIPSQLQTYLSDSPAASLPSQPPNVPNPQQLYHSSSRMYEAPVSRPSLGRVPYATGYGTSPGPGSTEQYYSGSPLYRSSSSMNPSPLPVVPVGVETNFQRLPTAKVLPQATPVVSGSGGSSGSRIPIDDLVDKVASMGFSREQVGATVRKLAENGQSVDLNVVLDKLMNGRGIGRPHKD